jgi:hypothetical protein
MSPSNRHGRSQLSAPERPPSTRADRYAWAMLLARIYEALPLPCPCCGGAMRIHPFVPEQAAVRRILENAGESARPSRLSPSRPPLWEEFAWGGVCARGALAGAVRQNAKRNLGW